MALLANLTLLPALLAVLGRSVFWPRIPEVGAHKGGALGPHRRQGGGKAGAHPGHRAGHLRRAGAVDAGLLPQRLQRPARRRPPPTPAGARPCWPPTSPRPRPIPTTVLFRLAASVWSDPAVLAEAQRGLVRSGEFSAVTGAVDPNGAMVAPTALAQAHALLSPTGPGRRPAPAAHRRASTVSPGRLRRLPGLLPVHQPRRAHHPVPDRAAGRARRQHRRRRRPCPRCVPSVDAGGPVHRRHGERRRR